MSLWVLGRTINRLNFTLLQSTLQRVMATAREQNRLKLEKSPYLLQHATNPVDWYPWGEEAFKAAREQNKLIFLSVGYSTCHWCHVMERESFENEEIAKTMNEHFINVKVDREERPDVDKVYMTFITAASGHGGWPMSVFLTPDLRPIAGGTYFPPKDKYGRPGFQTMINALSQKWKSDEKEFTDSAEKIMEVLKRNSKVHARSAAEIPSDEVYARGFSQLSRMYEPEYGGFGEAPKFPQPSNFNFLFAYKALNPDLENAQKGAEMGLHTLQMMDRGGIHDHVSQGFCRYSTDRKWHVPHFEKMLYDQAQLAMSYLDAFLLTKDECYADVVRDILLYVARDLSHPIGGFYSAEDADSFPSATSEKKREGAFCVWSYEEVRDLLSASITAGVNDDTENIKLFQVFNFHYSVMEGGNLDLYQDPHGEMENQNVLIARGTVAETANEFGLEEDQCRKCLEKCRSILYEARQKRPRPHLDDKILTAWNGMMLAAFAKAGAVFKDESYIQRATQNAEFIKKYLYKNGILLRSAYRAHENEISVGSEIRGYCDDYAWVIRGLYFLYNATLNDEWLRWAEELQDKQNDLFWDGEEGAYFVAEKDDTILLRLKEDNDGAEPSVNSVTSGNLVRLSRLLSRPDYEDKASTIFKVFSDQLLKVPVSLPEMATALMLYSNPAEQIILSGERDSPSFMSMLDVAHTCNLNPNRIIVYASEKHAPLLFSRQEMLKKCITKDAEAVAHICKNLACSLPLKSASLLSDKMASG